jgi:hypothetical protein
VIWVHLTCGRPGIRAVRGGGRPAAAAVIVVVTLILALGGGFLVLWGWSYAGAVSAIPTPSGDYITLGVVAVQQHSAWFGRSAELVAHQQLSPVGLVERLSHLEAPLHGEVRRSVDAGVLGGAMPATCSDRTRARGAAGSRCWPWGKSIRRSAQDPRGPARRPGECWRDHRRRSPGLAGDAPSARRHEHPLPGSPAAGRDAGPSIAR